MPEENIPIQEEAVSNSSTPPTQPIAQNNTVPQPASRLYRPLKIILGIATFWPIFFIATALTLGVLFISRMFIRGWDAPPPPATLLTELLTKQLVYLAPIFFYLTIILTFILPLIYIILVFKNGWISKNKKVWWIVIFSLGILFPILIISFLINKNFFFWNILFYLGIFLVTPYIAMPVYWYSHICKERNQNQLPKSWFRYFYIPILYFAAFLIIPTILIGNEIYGSVQEDKVSKKQDLERFENAQTVKAYLPTTLSKKWSIGNNYIESSNGVVKVDYIQVDFEQQKKNSFDNGAKWITMTEIPSPKTDIKCNNKTLLETDNKMFTVELPISDNRWLANCEELSISSGKVIISGYQEVIKPQNVFLHHNEFLMVFDKENTRIFLYYEQKLPDYLVSTENWSKKELIKVVENLRPISAKDFGL